MTYDLLSAQYAGFLLKSNSVTATDATIDGMPYDVYMVRCNNGSLYTGITNDVMRRVNQHNGELPGGAKYTKMHRPVKLVYRETYPSKEDAARREYALKQLSHTEKLKLVQNHKKNFTNSI